MISISVIIPVYNAEDHIERTVRIINEATVLPNEIILVNDGSQDNSLNVCYSLREEFSNIKVYTKKNGGVADARNYGLLRATSDYICFVDQDDFVDRLMYEKAISEIKRNDSDIVMFSTGQIINDNKIPFEQLKDSYFFDNEVINKLLYSFMFRGYEKIGRDNEFSITSSIWKCVIKKKLLLDNGIIFRRFISYEDDYIMMATLLCYAKKVSLLKYVGYYWLINSKSESHRIYYINEYGRKTLEFFDYMISVLKRTNIDDSVIEIYANQLLFEKTIDVIANAYSDINDSNKRQRVAEIEEYINNIHLFEMRLANIKPLQNYYRLRFLYYFVKRKNIKRLIKHVSRFVFIENRIHSNKVIMKILNSRK